MSRECRFCRRWAETAEPRISRSAGAAVCLLIAALAGCEAAPVARGPAIVDSAGITIVDHGPVDYASLPEWALAGAPEVRIGVVDGEPAYQWDQLFAAGRLSDGTLVALDRGSRHVRAFSPAGAHLWTAGRQGDGPGEFRAPWSLSVLDGDSVLITDPGTRRLTIIGPDGEFTREVSLDSQEGSVLGRGLSSGNELVVEARATEMTEIDRRKALITRSRFMVVDMEGQVLRDMGTYDLDIGYQEGGDEDGAFSGAIFDKPAVFAPDSAGVWFGDADSYQVSLHGEGGATLRIVRWQGPDRPITAQDLARLKDVWMPGPDEDPNLARYMERYFGNHPVAEQMATFERMLVDEVGRLWIQDYAREDLPDAPAAWLILTGDGTETLGLLTHPAGFKPFAIGDGWMLGASMDALDVEYLELYRFAPSDTF